MDFPANGMECPLNGMINGKVNGVAGGGEGGGGSHSTRPYPRPCLHHLLLQVPKLWQAKGKGKGQQGRQGKAGGRQSVRGEGAWG